MGPARVGTRSWWFRWDPLVLILLEHLEDGEEQVEDVEVKLHRRPDVLVICVTLYQVLGVVDDEA